jgi:hypothetical protein
MLRLVRIALPFSALYAFLKIGFLSTFGNYLTFILLYGLMADKRKLLIVFGFVSVSVAAMQSIKNDFRIYLGAGGFGAPMAERAEVLQFLLHDRYIVGNEKEEETNNADDDINTNLLKGFSRIGDDSLERVLYMTPSEVPFWEGETYQSIPYMFIPRALWPNKPGRDFWNKYGRGYRILSEDDIQTSVGVGFLAEAYMNFGFFGMYLLAGIMGIYFVCVERLSMAVLNGKFFFTYLSFLGPLIGLGADLGSIINSTMILTCVMFAIRPFLMRMARRDDYS